MINVLEAVLQVTDLGGVVSNLISLSLSLQILTLSSGIISQKKYYLVDVILGFIQEHLR